MKPSDIFLHYVAIPALFVSIIFQIPGLEFGQQMLLSCLGGLIHGAALSAHKAKYK